MIRGSHRADEGQRGFALLLVLWTLVLLTLIVSSLVAGGRGEVRLSANLRAAATAEALADGAVHEAVFRLLDPSEAGWRGDRVGDAAPRELPLPGGRAVVRIEDQAGLVNPNTVSDALMEALLRRAGADQRQAQSIAAAIADWRAPTAAPRPMGAKAPQYRQAGLDYAPPDAPFRSVAELRLVLGMTPVLFDQLAPNLTVFREGDPEGALAPPLVQQALRDVTGQASFPAQPAVGVRVLTISAAASGPGGGRFTRRAVVRIGSALSERPYRFLAWDRVED
ncbi:general secretion pathway protein GspK [Pararoseomonas indoligenes]|uniref:General secretion pathway protein GspK n=1 Tax=Roseomonas indoligenes TaxID=2820811 RepID=A0A940N2R4_9PROT|nr:type II secretion system protein GspK [Pararoseomonas indoligenes]MBP0494956.1 general secretion pathway protein GspK [Pararoseomonas indoligenes]